MTQRILTRHTVGITEFKANPGGALRRAGKVVAVLSHNRPMGYFVPPELFESMCKAVTYVQQVLPAATRGSESSIPSSTD